MNLKQVELNTVPKLCQIVAEQALEIACSASTKSWMAHMEGGTITEN